MEKTKDRFKKSIRADGQIAWNFQAFRTTRRGFRTKREAQQEYLRMKREHDKQKKLVGVDATFSHVGEKWFAHYVSLDEQKSNTYAKRKEELSTLNRFIGDEKLTQLTPERLQDLMFELKAKGIDGESKGYAYNSLKSLRQILNMIFRYATQFHLLNENPLGKTRIPKYKTTVEELKGIVSDVEVKYLTIEEVRALLSYALIYEELPLATLFHVLFYTGCRVSEALALQPDDIDFKRNEILFYKQVVMTGATEDFRIDTTKTFASARRVVVTDLVMEKLKHLIEALTEMHKQMKFQQQDFYLFVYLAPGKRGYPFRREYVNDHIKACVERSGIVKAFHTHLARHTMASLCAPYCSLDVIRERLGHTDETVTKIYRHITSNEKLKPLAAFDDLEN
ncbi:tyrosine-type recombinase/integrase [Tetragenococcus koreensis]|uniref:Integrase n=1 Tax=Tetragenococcus koreensis TaxID=290335 RepID=A0AAN4UC02_9ENTE|nr:tyrosine-type recombinase/integrase [Tetragenococcus koreensis]GEQ49632.1 integrase [Tetragenococcus koreensis]GEQ52078.1 integrase [Tetragenococcus koreensis]GEQ54613.1 integrase [Tetragenococcus koreensis]GEQ57107.1 integrase [Tetragenococcus koreensis]GEQ59645.1 integrase [Tetragenococcus koreensis]